LLREAAKQGPKEIINSERMLMKKWCFKTPFQVLGSTEPGLISFP
jgi:hypothetical protein